MAKLPWKELDILVNNCGTNIRKRAEEWSPRPETPYPSSDRISAPSVRISLGAFLEVTWAP